MNAWQMIAALLCVAWASGYVLWRCWQSVRHPQASSCSSCANSQTGIHHSPMVPVDVLLESPARSTTDGGQQNNGSHRERH